MKQEQGITLIISVVLLAAVTFVSFSLSTVILREISAAQLVLRSEPALSGANSGGEIALFRIQRELGNTAQTGSLSGSGATYTVTPDLYVDTYNFSIPCTTAELQVPLYDVENTYNVNADYGSATVTYNTGGCQLAVSYFSWTTPNNNLCQQTLVSSQNTTCSALNAGDGDDRYIISLKPQGGTGNAEGTITAKANNLSSTRGIPSETPNFVITGGSGNVERRIEIRLED